LLVRQKLEKVFYLAATLLAVSLVGGVAVADSRMGSGPIKNDSVLSRHIKDGTVREADLSDGVVGKLNQPGPAGPQGPMGATGATGPQGEQGEPGAAGVSGLETIATEIRVTGTASGQVGAICPEGKVAIGGGHAASADGADGSNTLINESGPGNLTQSDGVWSGDLWVVRFDNTATTHPSGQGNVKAYVNCSFAN
jgi:hypothetical protein